MSSSRLTIGSCGLVLAALLPWEGAARADSVEVDFNSDAFRAGYTLVREEKGLEFDFAWLHGSEEGDVGSAGLHVLGLAGGRDRPIEAGVGGELLFIDTDFESGGAVALGGYLRYRVRSLDRLELSVRLHYTPDALGFSGVESYFAAGFRAAYDVHDRASVFLGWRLVEADFENVSSLDIDDGIHIGLRLAL